ncbi:protein-disulfide reductase DsbD domain-containing protein [Acidipila rosea]|uniref:Disulfide bond corrector protein DsbC n=1 Tax=Acidipila rosea TaxID=768535 RepID=A0A4R1LA99_9BACT|nr:protein-disulfide reductase DsbD domain-containing protein [Acidipila rosea]TCK75348.1 disulfide bond corrector protein DsbC [Acidipila rosea]
MPGFTWAVLAFITLMGQQMPWQKDASQAKAAEHQSVEYLFPEQISVTAKKPTEVDLHFRVQNGLHINSHTPREKSFIRTELIVLEPQGVQVTAVDFPPGSDYALASMPSEKLSVYSGDFVLRAHITAQPGEHLVAAQLRYQACDINSCYPPRKLPLALDVIAK